MDEKKNVKICFAASSGGHYEQLMMLKPLMEKYDSFSAVSFRFSPTPG